MLHLRLSASLLLVAACCMQTHSKRVVTCDNGSNVQRLACGGGEVIHVQRALYGRTDQLTCSAGRPTIQITDILCAQENTLEVFSRRCNGRQVCEVNTQVFRFSDPCYGTFKYLDTTYTCIPATTVVSCEGQSAQLDCGRNKIKLIASNYGRRDGQTCSAGKPVSQVTKTDCILPISLSEVAKECEGKSKCSVPSTNGVFGDPCVGTYKYLEVSYTCVSTLQPSVPSYQNVACEGSVAHLECGSGVIEIRSAKYGRSDSTTCSFGQPVFYLNRNCSGFSTKLAEKCNGKSTCEVDVTSTLFGDPCANIYKYLDFSYSCVG